MLPEKYSIDFYFLNKIKLIGVWFSDTDCRWLGFFDLEIQMRFKKRIPIIRNYLNKYFLSETVNYKTKQKKKIQIQINNYF